MDPGIASQEISKTFSKIDVHSDSGLLEVRMKACGKTYVNYITSSKRRAYPFPNQVVSRSELSSADQKAINGGGDHRATQLVLDRETVGHWSTSCLVAF
jgi:hypothetical protein